MRPVGISGFWCFPKIKMVIQPLLVGVTLISNPPKQNSHQRWSPVSATLLRWDVNPSLPSRGKTLFPTLGVVQKEPRTHQSGGIWGIWYLPNRKTLTQPSPRMVKAFCQPHGVVQNSHKDSLNPRLSQISVMYWWNGCSAALRLPRFPHKMSRSTQSYNTGTML